MWIRQLQVPHNTCSPFLRNRSSSEVTSILWNFLPTDISFVKESSLTLLINHTGVLWAFLASFLICGIHSSFLTPPNQFGVIWTAWLCLSTSLLLVFFFWGRVLFWNQMWQVLPGWSQQRPGISSSPLKISETLWLPARVPSRFYYLTVWSSPFSPSATEEMFPFGNSPVFLYCLFMFSERKYAL